MRTSDKIDEISQALISAQSEFTPILKNKYNKFFDSYYADLASVIEATRPALLKYGLCLVQFPFCENGRAGVISKLIHGKSEQFFEDTLSLKPESDTPQKVGGTVTYARRYSAESLMGVSSEDDDDGNAAQGNQPDKEGKPIPQRQETEKPNEEKVYLNVAFSDKDKVKALGGKWDVQARSWYVFSGNTEALKQFAHEYEKENLSIELDQQQADFDTSNIF